MNLQVPIIHELTVSPELVLDVNDGTGEALPNAAPVICIIVKMLGPKNIFKNTAFSFAKKKSEYIFYPPMVDS